jgi:hypothetical protein
MRPVELRRSLDGGGVMEQLLGSGEAMALPIGRVSSGAGLRDCHSTNHVLILLALNFVFALILLLRDRKRAPLATLGEARWGVRRGEE